MTLISLANRELQAAAEIWRERDLSEERYKYLFIDGVHLKMRVKDSIENIPVLAVIGVNQDGYKIVLALQQGDEESASNRRELFKDLKQRGMEPASVELAVMDGLPGLEKVFKEEFSQAQVQRCQVHLARNVLTKVPRKLKKDVADDLRSIFYASSKKKACLFYGDFEKKWQKELPSAVKCLAKSLQACLTYLDFPEDEWIALRTTNVIE